MSSIHSRPALQFSSILFEVHSVLHRKMSKLYPCCGIDIFYYYYIIICFLYLGGMRLPGWRRRRYRASSTTLTAATTPASSRPAVWVQWRHLKTSWENSMMTRGQKKVVFDLCRPIAPRIHESQCGGMGGRGVAGLSQWVKLCTSRDMEPK